MVASFVVFIFNDEINNRIRDLSIYNPGLDIYLLVKAGDVVISLLCNGGSYMRYLGAMFHV